jgi:hypothetical protein
VKEEEEEDELDSTDQDEKPDLKDYESEEGDDDEEIVEIEDPHLSSADRKEQMEEEMSKDELDGLRGRWQEFIKTEIKTEDTTGPRSRPSTSAPSSKSVDDDEICFLGSSAGPSTSKEDVASDDLDWELDSVESNPGPSKRRKPVVDDDDEDWLSLSPSKRRALSRRSPPRPPPRPAQRPSRPTATPDSTAAPKFDHASIVRQERLRALGLVSSSPNGASSSRTLGPGPSSSRSGDREWPCVRCTYLNKGDRGQCGEYL